MIDEAASKTRRVNFYLTLDIGPGSSHNEILHAYNRAKNTYSGGSLASYTLMDEGDSSSIMEEIETAFAILGNPSKRREYDIEMGFNTWSDEPDHQPRDINAADLLGSQKQSKAPSAPQAQVIQPTPISSMAASIASMGDMNFEEPTTATVIQLKPQAVTQATPTQSTSQARQSTTQRSTPSVGGVEFEANPEFEKQIAACEEVTGEFLKAVRIYRRYTPESLALRCKLSTSHILTIENEDSSQMYQPVYLRGHVYLICHALDLPNPDRLSKKFVAQIVEAGKLQKKLF